MQESNNGQTALVIVKQFRYIVLAAATTLAVGMIFYHTVEKWSWIDSLYFCAVSLTTVGYGDLSPHTNIGKLFTVGYLIVGISIIAALLNNLLQHAVAKRQLKRQDKE